MEYRVDFNPPLRGVLDAKLKTLPFFVRYDAEYGNYEYRTSSNMDLTKMPDLVVAVREWGLYVCDYGSSEVFNSLLAALFHYVNGLGQAFVIADLE